jgi:GNAT superfamily N-acetyltransferase
LAGPGRDHRTVSNMAAESSLIVAPLRAETWPAFDALVQRHNGIFGGCWCTYFHPDSLERRQAREAHPQDGYEANRALKKRLVETGQAHAALVLLNDEAIAWAEYGTPEELPNLHHSKQYLAEADSLPDYRITCVFVDKRHRRQGVTELAITGALDLIAKAGGGRVESYPHDLTDNTKKMSSSFLYNGTRRLYERLGFTFDRPKGLRNCVMVRTIEPA